MDDVLEAAGHEDSEDLVEEKLQDGLTADTDEVLEAAGHKSSEDLVDEAVKKLENGLIAMEFLQKLISLCLMFLSIASSTSKSLLRN